VTTKAGGRLRLLGEVVIKELQEQGRYECDLARFSIDDDFPHAPEGYLLSSAQSHRSLPVEVH